MRRPSSTAVVTIATAAALLAGASAASANSPTPEQQCQGRRYVAAARYNACALTATSRVFGGFAVDGSASLGKCRVKYTATWDKLVARGSGTTTCVGDRFVDNGDGTVTDNLTRLQWEKKTNLDGVPSVGDRHDADNTYTWSTTGTLPDGTVHTDFLATLNSGACFTGRCDWRVPTAYELQTILAEPYPCIFTSPCSEPILGPTVADLYWSSTTDAGPPAQQGQRLIRFDDGYVAGFANASSHYVRAVRGGF